MSIASQQREAWIETWRMVVLLILMPAHRLPATGGVD